MKHKTELILRELQKHFRGEWLVYIEDLAMVTLPAHGVGGARMGSGCRGEGGLAGTTEA